MKFGPIRVADAEGTVLAHTVAAGDRTWRKGAALTGEDVAAMARAGLESIVAVVMEPGDIGEDAAAALVAAGLYAPGLDIRPAATGRVNIHALDAGVFLADRAGVDAINAVDPAITLATLPDLTTVEAGQMLATVKIVPFAVADALARRAADIAASAGAIGLRLFQPRRVGLAQTVLPSVKGSVLDKTARITAERLARSGSVVTGELRVPHDEASVAGAVAELARDNDMVIVFGASAVCDAGDVIPAAIGLAGGTVTRVGMPVDPGNLLVVGDVGGKTVIGAPGCARSPKPNGFDRVLDRMLAGLEVGDREIAAMGVGGLLMEIESRPQPREPRARNANTVYAVLLAAGRGERMGGRNKLLADFAGKPLVRHALDALAASRVRATVAVVGHEREKMAAALHGSPARIVENPDYATGLASSLKAGVNALPPDAAGALVALADMPGVRAQDIDRLLDTFAQAQGNAIVRATHGGKRGNPLILPRALFGALATLAGDVGARHLVETSEIEVIDVEIGEGASLDVDTPAALAAVRAALDKGGD